MKSWMQRACPAIPEDEQDPRERGDSFDRPANGVRQCRPHIGRWLYAQSVGRMQARSGKRTPFAALRIATDLVKEGKITPKAALASIKGIDLEAIKAVELAPPAGTKPATAIPASSGVAVGVEVFDPDRIAAYSQRGKPVVLLRERTETSDIRALAEAQALVTARGARTSHAAVVARQLGKVCLVGCQSLVIDESSGRYALGGVDIKEGETLTVDGTTGAIFRGAIHGHAYKAY